MACGFPDRRGGDMSDRYPFLISIPHGGVCVPPEVRRSVNLSRREIISNSDPSTRLLYGFRGTVEEVVDMEASRIFVDANRPPYAHPPVTQDGVVKMVTQDGTPVYKKGQVPDTELIGKLLERYYYPFHDRLKDAAEVRPIEIAFDCHSMLPNAPPVQMRPGRPRPLICLSNRGDRRGMPFRGEGLVTCPPEWLQALAGSFQAEFAGEGRVLMNDPFRGGFISVAHYRRTRIPWVQVEINRSLYETGASVSQETQQVDDHRVADLRERILSALTRFWDDVGG
jgi:N-formylglutamate deformylase